MMNKKHMETCKQSNKIHILFVDCERDSVIL